MLISMLQAIELQPPERQPLTPPVPPPPPSKVPERFLPKVPVRICPVVFLDVAINGVAAGRIEIMLRPDVVPITSENFRCLCTGEKGEGLCFKGSAFHAIKSGLWAKGGDITNGDGTGGRCIYEADEYRGTTKYAKKFANENFKLDHSEAGVVSMVSQGRGRNTSQFLITFAELCEELDCRHVVFGR